MSVMLDQKLVFVLNLIGFNWPQADEDKLKESARHWREYATGLEYVIADSNRILDQITAENSGESIDALEQHWRQFGDHLRQAHEAAGVMAEVLDGFALVVEGLKLAVLVQLGILAAELAATTGAAFLTFGVAEAAAPEEIAITQVAMRWLSREAFHKAEHLVAERITKTVTEKFLSIKNGLKALNASRTALVDFGKGLARAGGKELKNAPTAVEDASPLSRVPKYAGGKTSGILDTGSEHIELQSGYAGPSSGLPRTGNPGMNWNIRSHVEAHASAVIRQQRLDKATLYINQHPCPGRSGCDAMLPRMLPEGAKLRVIGPEGYDKVFTGLPD